MRRDLFTPAWDAVEAGRAILLADDAEKMRKFIGQTKAQRIASVKRGGYKPEGGL